MSPLVRLCPYGFWGVGEITSGQLSEDSCQLECPDCYNGGVCNEDLGECICAPGFRGEECEEICPQAGRWGQDCELRLVNWSNQNFPKKTNFLSKIKMFVKNQNVCQKIKFLSSIYNFVKIEIFCHNSQLWNLKFSGVTTKISSISLHVVEKCFASSIHTVAPVALVIAVLTVP